MKPSPCHRPLRGSTSRSRPPVRGRTTMIDPHRHPNRHRSRPGVRNCLGAFVDIPAARRYHRSMPFLADADLAVRPDPERQTGRAEIPRQDGESRRPRRARLSIPSVAVRLTTDRSPSSFSRHTARTAPPSLPAIASALARQRFSLDLGTGVIPASCRRAICAPAPHRHSSATNGGAPTDTPPTGCPPKGAER